MPVMPRSSTPVPLDEVLLQVPARSEYARLVRIGAAALALRQGMAFGEIDDLRLAIDEALIALLTGDDPGADIDITYRIDATFELEAKRTTPGRLDPAAIERFEELASGLVDTYDIDDEHGAIRLRKRPADAD